MRKAAYLLVTAIAVVSAGSHAQNYPTRPIRVIVGAAAGGQSDIGARLLGNELTKRLGQPIIVENRPGANAGTLGGNAVARSAPDGYTLFFGGVTSMHPVFTKNNPVDARKDLAAVSNFYTGAYAFYISGKAPYKTLPELVAYSKVNPGKLNFGSPASQATELMMKMVQVRTGMDYTVIPYKGAPQVGQAMLAGEAAMSISSPAPYKSQLDAGTIRALFVTTAKRSTFLPNVPTTAEVGIPNYVVGWANGLWAPAGTPAEIIRKVSAEAQAVPKIPEIATQIRNVATAEPDGSTPEEQLAFFDTEFRFWVEAAKVANFEPQ